MAHSRRSGDERAASELPRPHVLLEVDIIGRPLLLHPPSAIAREEIEGERREEDGADHGTGERGDKSGQRNDTLLSLSDAGVGFDLGARVSK